MLRGEKAGDVERRRQIPKRKSPASTKPARAPEPPNRMLGEKCAQGRYSSDVRELSSSDPQPPNDVQRIENELAPFRGKNETGGRTIEGQIELEWPDRSERALRAQIASHDPQPRRAREGSDRCGKRPRRWSMDRGREAGRRLAVPRSPRRPRSRRPLTRRPEPPRRKDLLPPRSHGRSARDSLAVAFPKTVERRQQLHSASLNRSKERGESEAVVDVSAAGAESHVGVHPNASGRHFRDFSGRPSGYTSPLFMLRAGIVGLPNVGKSTLFNALTRTRKAEAANYPFLHHRTQRRRRGRAGRAPGAPRADRQDNQDRSRGDRVRGHRRARARRVEGRGARQQVPPAHPGGRRDRRGRPVLREQGHRSRLGTSRSGRRHGNDQDRARSRGSRDSREIPREAREASPAAETRRRRPPCRSPTSSPNTSTRDAELSRSRSRPRSRLTQDSSSFSPPSPSCSPPTSRRTASRPRLPRLRSPRSDTTQRRTPAPRRSSFRRKSSRSWRSYRKRKRAST